MKNRLSYKNPYPGLRSFNINEGDLFFGRDKQISELLEILNDSRFAAISGASGSGKSSLIKAGLIPRMIQDSSEWNYI
jgi:putative ribosome biogenesis GTPase RsgA